MMHKKLLVCIIATTALFFCFTAVAGAECAVKGTGEVNIISNSFPVLEVIAGAFKTCNRTNLKIAHKLTTEHKEETNQAFASSSSPYDMAQVANSSITPLQASGTIQPLDDLVVKYKTKYNIEDGMLIRFGDDIMAIAFQVNAQHLFFRKDLLQKHNIRVPKTYADVLAAAEKLTAEKSIDFPLTGTYKAGWNLAQEFVNLYLASGGELFQPGSAKPAINSKIGLQTLALMKKLMSYMSPNALSVDSKMVKQQLQQGRVAMANLWASEASKMDDKAESKVIGLVDFAPAPTVLKDGAPATTVWWDGFVLAKNMDGDRDLTFQVMMEGLKEEVVKTNNDVAIWIRTVYEPTRYSRGAAESAMAGAPPYPMLPSMGLLHASLGGNIGDFLSGKESAEESLADAERAYLQAAKEKGYLK